MRTHSVANSESRFNVINLLMPNGLFCQYHKKESVSRLWGLVESISSLGGSGGYLQFNWIPLNIQCIQKEITCQTDLVSLSVCLQKHTLLKTT